MARRRQIAELEISAGKKIGGLAATSSRHYGPRCFHLAFVEQPHDCECGVCLARRRRHPMLDRAARRFAGAFLLWGNYARDSAEPRFHSHFLSAFEQLGASPPGSAARREFTPPHCPVPDRRRRSERRPRILPERAALARCGHSAPGKSSRPAQSLGPGAACLAARRRSPARLAGLIVRHAEFAPTGRSGRVLPASDDAHPSKAVRHSEVDRAWRGCACRAWLRRFRNVFCSAPAASDDHSGAAVAAIARASKFSRDSAPGHATAARGAAHVRGAAFRELGAHH
jgi:hypothetical protein